MASIQRGWRFMPVTVRSKMVLEIASKLVGTPGWEDRQAKLSLRPQGPGQWNLTLLGSDSADAVADIASKEAQLAMRSTGRSKSPFRSARSR